MGGGASAKSWCKAFIAADVLHQTSHQLALLLGLQLLVVRGLLVELQGFGVFAPVRHSNSCITALLVSRENLMASSPCSTLGEPLWPSPTPVLLTRKPHTYENMLIKPHRLRGWGHVPDLLRI